MTLDDLPDYVSEQDLASFGFDAEDVRRLCPGAVEYQALDGSPCWSRDDLAPLFRDQEEEQR